MDYNGPDTNGSGTTDPLNGFPHPSRYTRTRIVLSSVAVTVVMATIVMGNCFVIVAVFVDRRLKSLQNWFIVSLAVSDLLVGVFIMPLSLANELMGYWYFGMAMCDLWLATDVLLCTASILNLCLISLDRYWSVVRATDGYAQRRTKRRVLAMIAVVWALSVAISLPPLVGWKRPQPQKLGYPLCVLSEEPGYVVYSTVGSFFVPLVIMVLVYVQLYRTAVTRGRRTLRKSSLAKEKEKEKERKLSSAVDRKKNCSLRTSTTNDGRNFELFKMSRGSTKEYRSLSSKADYFHSEDFQPPPPPVASTRRFTCARTETNQRLGKTEVCQIPGRQDELFVACTDHKAVDCCGQHMLSAESDDVGTSRESDFKSKNFGITSSTGSAFRQPMTMSRDDLSSKSTLVKAESDAALLNPQNSVDDDRRRLTIVDNTETSCCQPKHSAYDPDSRISHPSSGGPEELEFPARIHSSSACNEARRSLSLNDKEIAANETKSRRRRRRRRGVLLMTAETSSGGGGGGDDGLPGRLRVVRAREKKATLVLGLVMASFVGCWLPFFATYVFVSVTGTSVADTTFAVIFWLGYCNSALNPAIYTVFNRDFRAAFFRIVCRFGRLLSLCCCYCL